MVSVSAMVFESQLFDLGLDSRSDVKVMCGWWVICTILTRYLNEKLVVDALGWINKESTLIVINEKRFLGKWLIISFVLVYALLLNISRKFENAVTPSDFHSAEGCRKQTNTAEG